MPVKFSTTQQDDTIIRFLSANGFDHTTDHHDAHFVVFTGGEDVTPFLYGEKQRKETSNNFIRDREEVKLFKLLSPQKPKVGICRGAQFLNVMSGGRLYQHVTNHAINGLHEVRVMNEATTFQVTSTHHQMMRVSDDAQVLACAQIAMCKYTDEDETRYNQITRKEQWDDVEAAYYWQTNCLCYQPHPEYPVKGNKDNQEYFLSLLDQYALSKEQALEVEATKAQRKGRVAV